MRMQSENNVSDHTDKQPMDIPAFEKEAADTFEKFPELKDSTFFSILSKVDQQKATFVNDVKKFNENKPKNFQAMMQNVEDILAYKISDSSKPGYSSGAIRDNLPGSKKDIYQLVMLDRESGEMIYPANPTMGLKFTLDHEIGHLLVKDAHISDSRENIQYRESAADAFAVIRTFQRYGNTKEARDMLEHVSASRSINALTRYDFKHLTTSVIERMLEDSLVVDFSTIPIEQAKKVAAEYARKCVVTQENINDAATVFTYENALLLMESTRNDMAPEQRKTIAENLATTCLSTNDRFTFTVGARLFQPFISGDDNTLPVEIKSKYLADISAKAKEMNLKGLANSLQGKTPDAPTSKFVAPAEPEKKSLFAGAIAKLKSSLLSPATKSGDTGKPDPKKSRNTYPGLSV